MRKPAWAVEKERMRKQGPEPVWLFGLHAVRDALTNPDRSHERLVLTRNAAAKLEDAIAAERKARAAPNPPPTPLNRNPPDKGQLLG